MDTKQSQLTFLGFLLGGASIGMLNRGRHRPVMYQPWLHLIAASSGAYLGGKLGLLYDDTYTVLARQQAAYASLPSWAYAQLSPEELSAELRDKRLAEAARKFNQLADIEEKEFLAAGKGTTLVTPTKLQ